MIGVREIGDVEAVSLVGGHHRERLVVDIGCDAALGHLLDNFVGLFAGAALKTDQVKMMRRTMIWSPVIQILDLMGCIKASVQRIDAGIVQ